MKKWINWIALVIAFSVACGFLSDWQFHRRAEKLDAIALVERNYDSKPVSLDSVPGDIGKVIWQPVEISGHYISSTSLLVRNRPNDGNAGFEQVVLFQTDSGQTIFLSRGWVATGTKQDNPDYIPIPSAIETSVIGRILPFEPSPTRTAPAGQTQAINLKVLELASHVRASITAFYLRIASENPSVSSRLDALPPPSTDEGNNLSYAIQWIMFAVMAAYALIWRIRRDRLLAAGVQPKVRKTRAKLDEDYEDSTTTQ